MPDMVKERIVVVEEGADLLRDAVVREPAVWATIDEAMRFALPGDCIMQTSDGWVRANWYKRPVAK